MRYLFFAIIFTLTNSCGTDENNSSELKYRCPSTDTNCQDALMNKVERSFPQIWARQASTVTVSGVEKRECGQWVFDPTEGMICNGPRFCMAQPVEGRINFKYKIRINNPSFTVSTGYTVFLAKGTISADYNGRSFDIGTIEINNRYNESKDIIRGTGIAHLAKTPSYRSINGVDQGLIVGKIRTDDFDITSKPVRNFPLAFQCGDYNKGVPAKNSTYSVKVHRAEIDLAIDKKIRDIFANTVQEVIQ